MRELVLAALFTLAAPLLAQEGSGGYLGIQASELNAESRAAFDIPDDVKAGVVIAQVVDGTAAANAGLRAGDVIVRFAGTEVTSVETLVATIVAKRPGDKVGYVVRRGNGTIDGRLTLGKREQPALEPVPVPVPEEPRPERDMDKRLDRLEDDLSGLRELAKKRGKRAKAARAPSGLTAWIEREERSLAEARERGAERAVAHRESRLSILREMAAARVELPDARMARIEKKLDEILELLRR